MMTGPLYDAARDAIIDSEVIGPKDNLMDVKPINEVVGIALAAITRALSEHPEWAEEIGCSKGGVVTGAGRTWMERAEKAEAEVEQLRECLRDARVDALLRAAAKGGAFREDPSSPDPTGCFVAEEGSWP